MEDIKGSVTEQELQFIGNSFKYLPAPDVVSKEAANLLYEFVISNEVDRKNIRLLVLDKRKELLNIADSDYHYALNHACNVVWHFGQGSSAEYARLCIKYLGEHIKRVAS